MHGTENMKSEIRNQKYESGIKGRNQKTTSPLGDWLAEICSLCSFHISYFIFLISSNRRTGRAAGSVPGLGLAWATAAVA
jgi:hypothetical protein